MLHKAWNSKEEMPYCFPRSSIKFQGHTGQNITDFDPNWAFSDYRPVAAFKSLRFALFSSVWFLSFPLPPLQILLPSSLVLFVLGVLSVVYVSFKYFSMISSVFLIHMLSSCVLSFTRELSSFFSILLTCIIRFMFISCLIGMNHVSFRSTLVGVSYGR